MTEKARSAHVPFAYQSIAEQIAARIVRGELNPGDQLPGEVELGAMFGVTRSTVRESLRQLESDGLVHRPSPRRLEVSQPQSEQLASRAGRTMAIMKVTFRELWEVVMVTEPMAARLAAERATDEQIDQLQAIHTDMMSAEGDIGRTIELDTQFHSSFAEASGNRVLVLAREPITLLLFRGQAQLAPLAPKFYKRQIEAHSHIIAAMRDRDPERSERWTRKHIEDFWRGVQIAGLEESIAIDPEILT